MSKIDPGVADEIRQLAQRPSFKLLAAEVERERDEHFQRLARALSSRGKAAPPVNQRSLDYDRGFWDGAMATVKDYPLKAERAWSRHLKEESDPE